MKLVMKLDRQERIAFLLAGIGGILLGLLTTEGVVSLVFVYGASVILFYVALAALIVVTLVRRYRSRKGNAHLAGEMGAERAPGSAHSLMGLLKGGQGDALADLEAEHRREIARDRRRFR